LHARCGVGCAQTTADHWFLYTSDNRENESILTPSYAAATNPSTPNRSPKLTAAAAPAAVALVAPAAAAAAADAKAGDAKAAAASATPLSIESGLQALSGAQRLALAQYLTQVLGKPVSAGNVTGATATAAVTAAAAAPLNAPKGDQTLELLMSELDQGKMKIFTKNAAVSAEQVTHTSGIGALYPDALIDQFVFDPCGYSMNGLRGPGYFTVHTHPSPLPSAALSSLCPPLPPSALDFDLHCYRLVSCHFRSTSPLSPTARMRASKPTSRRPVRATHPPTNQPIHLLSAAFPFLLFFPLINLYAALSLVPADGNYFSLIQQNLNIFGPGKFTLIFFTTEPTHDQPLKNSLVRCVNLVSAASPSRDARVLPAYAQVFGDFQGYTRSGASVCPFTTYTVIYCHYQKEKR
jgi:hypothetical protein